MAETQDELPLISIVTPVYRTPPEYLRDCVDSVLAQTGNNWELIVIDDGSDDPDLTELLEAYAEADSRILLYVRDRNGGIVEASNDGLRLANGEYIVFLDHDDLLTKSAISVVTKAVRANPAAEILYSDRRHVNAQGKRTGPDFFKPDWSPERFRSNMYIAHLTVVKRSAALEVGAFDPEFEGSQDHDLLLRISERGNPVIHIRLPLYQWRASENSTALDPDAKPYAAVNGLKAVAAHCERMGIRAKPEHAERPGFYVLNRTPEPGSKVTIIVPTCGTHANVLGEDRCLVVGAVTSVSAHEYVADYEIVVVYDKRGDLSYLDDVVEAGKGRVRLLEYAEPFNFSRKCNVAAIRSDADVVLLLNDDIEVISPNWLDHMCALAMEPDVGAVGLKLYFENGLLQHAGLGTSLGNAFANGWGTPDQGGHFSSTIIDHEVIGVTGACMAVRRDVYLEVGGFCEDYAGSFNDVDFSFKMLRAGYRNIAANSLSMYHFESLSRDPAITFNEESTLLSRWKYLGQEDRFTRGKTPGATPKAARKNARKFAEGEIPGDVISPVSSPANY